MTTENLITLLDLARMELEEAYKRLGYYNSNVLTSINKSIVHLQRQALSQAAVSGTFCRITKVQISSIKSLKDDCLAMLGNGEDGPDEIWINHIKNIDRFLRGNGFAAK